MSEMFELGMEAALVQIKKNLYDERIRMKGRLLQGSCQSGPALQ